jgi:predicted NBD/HSP70 family sugar kinase
LAILMVQRSPGSNIVGVGAYNERLVLSLIRNAGELSKAELTQATSLSAQTLTAVVGRLEANGLVSRKAPRRGGLGQPSVPYALNPDGAYTLGLKVGRRSFELILMNFIGGVVMSFRKTYDYPTPARLVQFFKSSLAALVAETPKAQFNKVIGVGVAMPGELWNWHEEMEAPARELSKWRNFDLLEALQDAVDLPIHVLNDATAACIGEHIFGTSRSQSDFQYFYIGTFLGGGLILNGTIFNGLRSNAGAAGSMLVPGGSLGANTAPSQLLSVASVMTLHRDLKRHNQDTGLLWLPGSTWEGLGEALDLWIESASWNLAFASINSVSVVDVPRVVIDGSIPEKVCTAIVKRTAAIVQKMPTVGLSPFVISKGSLGPLARVIGAASIPLHADFARDHGVLLK